jgi:predicted dehydrogenase
MSNTSRREFLQSTALAGAGFWLAGGVSLADKKESPNDRIRIACIGVGGKGSGDTDQAGQVGEIVALCDIDDTTLGNKAEKFPKAKKYNDFRKMFDEMARSIDAVTVSTPDHTHALPSMIAMQLGKHVYCQKPMTHTVFEARQMREAARKYKVATQMGNQGSASDGLRRGVEVLQAGVIGPIQEVHVWTNRPIWPQAPKVITRPEPSPVPQGVHWDLFLGPAPERPYAIYPKEIVGEKARRKGAYHSFNWRGWWDFGTGALGDMACHTANLAFRALKLGYPTSIVAESGPVNPETCPGWARIVFEFPAREGLPPVKLTWYEGHQGDKRVLPPEELTRGLRVPTSGSLFVGAKGMLFSPDDNGTSFKLLPEDRFKEMPEVPMTLPRNGKGDLGMKQEWAAAMRGGPPAYSNFDFAGMLTEAILLGNVAIRVGKKLEWDGPSLKCTNCPEADQYIKTEYRKGWSW